MYYRFGKVFYFLGVIIFLFTLLYFYAALPEQVGFQLDEEGSILREYAKNTFFYALAFGFLILNLVTIYTPKTLETKTNRKLHRLFPIGDPYRDYLLAWFYSFGGWINFSLALSGFYVYAINNQEELNLASYNFWFFLMPVLLFSWVGILFVLLFKKFKATQVDVN